MNPKKTLLYKTTRPRLSILSSLFLLALTMSPLFGQAGERSVPVSAINSTSNGSTSIPFANPNDNSVQFIYDNHLDVLGSIQIHEIYMRAFAPGSAIANFSYDDVQITLFHAATTPATMSATYLDNIGSGKLVREGPYSRNFDIAETDGTANSGWVPLKLQKSFLYDPAVGPLGIQIRICGVNTHWGTGINSETFTGSSMTFHGSSCTAVAGQSVSTNSVPVIKLDFSFAQIQTLPANQENINSNSSTNFPAATPNDQIWQWHYDSAEFLANGPITISDIAIRPNSTSIDLNTFEFDDFEVTLIEASTDYQVGNHDTTFANNVLRSKIVRAGSWKAPRAQGTGSGSPAWVSLQLENTFDYDPTNGNDFIVQIRSCNVLTPWNIGVDAVAGSAGTNGGNRYGHTSDCNSPDSNFNNNELVPVVRIAWQKRTITAYPYREKFDFWNSALQGSGTPYGWLHQSGNTANWQFHDRETSLGTAKTDLTTGLRGQGKYMTTDDSDSATVERIESPIFNLIPLTDPVATFWIYSFATLAPDVLDANEFDVFLKDYTGGGPPTIVPLPFDKVRVLRHGCWTKFAIDLSAFTNDSVSIVFEGETDSENLFYHDFAIDDVWVGNRFSSLGGQAARPFASLDINDSYNINGEHVGSGADGPYYACGKPLGVFNVDIYSGAPGQPTALWVGPLNIGVADFGPAGRIDTGTPDVNGDSFPESIFVLGSGLNLTPTFLDLFFFTDAAGHTRISLPINPAFPAGTLGTFQAATTDGLGGIFVTNAVVFDIVP